MRCEIHAISCGTRKELSDKYGEALRKNCSIVTKEGAWNDQELIIAIDGLKELIQLEKDIENSKAVQKSFKPYSGLIINHQWHKDMIERGIDCSICIADDYTD